MKKIAKRFQPLLIVAVLVLTALSCSLPARGSAPPPLIITATPLPPMAPMPSPLSPATSAPTATLQPSETPEPGPVMLKLDQDYYCRKGPNPKMPDITGFKKGTELPLLGTNGLGWYLVEINLDWTQETSCWIAGGLVESGSSSVPQVTPEIAVPVHEYSNWKVIGFLGCSEIEYYNWTERNAGENKFESDVVLFGSKHATIEYSEWIIPCPDFYP